MLPLLRPLLGPLAFRWLAGYKYAAPPSPALAVAKARRSVKTLDLLLGEYILNPVTIEVR